MLLPLLIFTTSFSIVFFAIPRIILVANQRNLFDEPREKRKKHNAGISNLGGIAIFIGVLLTQSLFIDAAAFPSQILVAAALILFMLGLKDDLIGMHPLKKLITQIAAALIIAYWGDIRFLDLGGLLTIDSLPYILSIFLTVFFIVGLINSLNLIDGIDGLAGSQGLIISLVFGGLFYLAGENAWSLICLAVSGSLLGFLYYNLSPAKIFMGDSGAFQIGLYISVLCIVFVDVAINKSILIGQFEIESGFGIIAALIMIPVFDSSRVFILRIWKKAHPFRADSNHLHHRLLEAGLTHTQTSLFLSSVTLLLLFTAIYFQNLGNTYLILLLFLMMLCVNLALFLYLEKYKKLDKAHLG